MGIKSNRVYTLCNDIFTPFTAEPVVFSVTFVTS